MKPINLRKSAALALFTIFVILCIAIAVSLLELFHFKDAATLPVYDSLNFPSESSVGTWLSSLSFLFIAAFSFILGRNTEQKVTKLLYYILFGLSVFFSIDDTAKIHERLGSSFDIIFHDSTFTAILEGFPSYRWLLLYSPLLLVYLFSIVFTMYREKASLYTKLICITALFYLCLSQLLDFWDGYDRDFHWTRFFLIKAGILITPEGFRFFIRSLEEVFEIFGQSTLAYYLALVVHEKVKDQPLVFRVENNDD